MFFHFRARGEPPVLYPREKLGKEACSCCAHNFGIDKCNRRYPEFNSQLQLCCNSSNPTLRLDNGEPTATNIQSTAPIPKEYDREEHGEGNMGSSNILTDFRPSKLCYNSTVPDKRRQATECNNYDPTLIRSISRGVTGYFPYLITVRHLTTQSVTDSIWSRYFDGYHDHYLHYLGLEYARILGNMLGNSSGTAVWLHFYVPIPMYDIFGSLHTSTIWIFVSLEQMDYRARLSL